jgi:hypothetical protein
MTPHRRTCFRTPPGRGLPAAGAPQLAREGGSLWCGDGSCGTHPEYLERFKSWGSEFFERPLTFDEFEELAANIKPARGAKTQIVNQAIERQFGEFSLSDIERECPAISRDMIKIIFRELQKAKKIECLGKGKSAKWKKS